MQQAPWDPPGLPPKDPRCANHTNCAYRDDDQERCSQCHAKLEICNGNHRVSVPMPIKSVPEEENLRSEILRLPRKVPMTKAEMVAKMRIGELTSDKAINDAIAWGRKEGHIVMVGSRRTARYYAQ